MKNRLQLYAGQAHGVECAKLYFVKRFMNTEHGECDAYIQSVGNTPALRGGGASTDLDTSNLPCELGECHGHGFGSHLVNTRK